MKRYTCDKKLLTELPEVEFNSRIYGVDNRYKTVQQFASLQSSGEPGEDQGENLKRLLALALGEEAVGEINPEELPMPALMNLIEVVVAAATGEEPEDVAARFQAAKETVKR